MNKIMKAMLWFIAILFIVGMWIQLTSAAEPTHQYIKQYMDPLYRQNLDDGDQYPYTLVIDTPDGITEIVSAMLTLQVWHNPTVTYYVTVNGQTCNTAEFLVHTTYANAGEGTVYFDCSNVITGEGTYDVLLWTDDDTGASTFWADITYSNAPKGTVEVHGTEYVAGDRAKLWVQLLDATGDDVEDGACQIDIYTPVNTVLIENGAMTNMEHDGIYYYDLLAPQSHGVYPAIAKCYYSITSTDEYADSFNLITGTIDNGDYTDTWALDGDEHKIKQLLGSIEYTYDIDNMCGLTTDELLLTGVTVSVNSKWTDSATNDNIIISVYNFTSSSWINLPNSIDDPNDRLTVSNFIATNNITRDGLVDGSGTLRVHFNDTLKGVGTDKKIEMDLLEVSCEEFSSPIWTEVKGSSEMHISGDYRWSTQIESGQIFNDTWPGEFHYNVTLSSQTAQTEEDEEIFVEMPVPFPCHHVISLSIDGVDTNWTAHDPIIPDTAGCSVEWVQDLGAATNYDIQIIAENYFKEVESTWVTESAFDYSMINIACKNYQITNGYPNFTIPMTEAPENEYNDEFMAVCADYLDTYHHWNDTYWNEFRTDVGVFTEADMDSLNEMWRHLYILTDRLQDSSTNILGGLNAGASYSTAIIANPTGQTIPGWATYWANASTTFINYQLLSAITGGVVIIPAVINETSLANAVWGSSATPASNILNAFSANIWSYSDRQLTSFNFLVGLNSTALSDIWSYATRTLTAFSLWEHETAAEYVWNSTNRTLTLSPFDPATIATAVWNNPNRNLTSFDFVVDAEVDWETGALYFWNSTTRGLTEAVNANVDWSTGAEYTWNATTRELTAIQWDHEDAALYAWNSTSRELTTSPFDPTAIANATWNYADRGLTEFDFVVDTTVDYSSIGEYVWNTTTRGLTENTNPNIDWTTGAQFVWNATTRELTAISWDHENAAAYVWNSTINNRSLTDSPFDPAAIASAVWAFTDRNLTYLDWSTGSDYVWNNTAKELTGFDFVVEATINNSELVFDVWNAADRELTNFTFTVDTTLNESEISTLTADQVWSYYNRSLTDSVVVDTNSQNEIRDAVWAYVNRTLTEAPFDPNLIANATWEWDARYTHGVDLT